MIATHSLDMIKYLEVIRKKEELAESLIALNCLTIEGKIIQEEADFDTQLNAIKQELSEPFYNLFGSIMKRLLRSLEFIDFECHRFKSCSPAFWSSRLPWAIKMVSSSPQLLFSRNCPSFFFKLIM
jgi:hypothetical protein